MYIYYIYILAATRWELPNFRNCVAAYRYRAMTLEEGAKPQRVGRRKFIQAPAKSRLSTSFVVFKTSSYMYIYIC